MRQLIVSLLLLMGLVGSFVLADVLVAPQIPTIDDRMISKTEYDNVTFTDTTTDQKCIDDYDAWFASNPAPDNKTATYDEVVTWQKDMPVKDACYSTVERVEELNTTTQETYQVVTLGEKQIDSRDLDVWCYDNVTAIVCKSNLDGDGWTQRKEIKPGTSFFVVPKVQGEKVVESREHLAKEYDSVLMGLKQ